MKKATKEKLINKYMTGIPELTDYQKEWIRKETAHYIFVSRDDKGKHHGYCTRCRTEMDLPKTKHRNKVTCPVCGEEMEVIHNWRMTGHPVTYDWVAIPKAIDKNTLMLRYVLVFRNTVNGKDSEDIKELARMVFKVGNETLHTFELHGNVWEYSTRDYFKEYYMWNYRKICCLPANPYLPTWTRELKKLDCLKYIPNLRDYATNKYYIHYAICKLFKNAALYEKLYKAGLSDLAIQDYEFYEYDYNHIRIEFNDSKTSLTGMLGINRTQLKLLKSNQSLEALKYIKMFPNINQELLNLLIISNVTDDELRAIGRLNVSLTKTLRYFIRTKCNHREWIHYADLLSKLNYRLDDAYLYPGNFRKEDARVSDEWEAKMDELKRNEDTIRNELIRKISVGLHNNQELRKFFMGSDGLQVLIPETVDDLRREGKALHNCLGTYIERYSEGKTLIFFVRRIEDPTAPYIAMEYCYGRVIQCRYDYNKSVEDEKVINFTNALAKALAKENILAA